MELYIYSDESGVFDVAHNQIFVFAGVVFTSTADKDIAARKYLAAESVIRQAEAFPFEAEIKASKISNKAKGKLFRSLNNVEKFGVVVRQKLLHSRIFEDKKTKQRYLDYAYKIAVKRKFLEMVQRGKLALDDISALHFFVDAHKTATDGRYELEQALEQEFKYGTFNRNYAKHFPPIFKNLRSVHVRFCDSKQFPLIRAADITANRLYYHAINGGIAGKNYFDISYLP